MIPVSKLFEIQYGHSLELNRLLLLAQEHGGIPFVSRKMGDNGISAYVAPIAGINPAPAGELTCALSGNGVLSTFLQKIPFYTGFHVARLKPLIPMTKAQLLYYCACITSNRYRFSYGRQANRTLKHIELPEKVPTWVSSNTACLEFPSLVALKALSSQGTLVKSTKDRELVPISDLFDIYYGTNHELNVLELDAKGINFVSRSAKNNGVSAKVKLLPGNHPIQGGVLTVAGGGSVLETFLQLEPFYSGRDLFYLAPKHKMSVEELLYYAFCIKNNRFRYSYGRQANRTLKDTKIPARSAVPVWIFGSLVRVVEQIESSLNA